MIDRLKNFWNFWLDQSLEIIHNDIMLSCYILVGRGIEGENCIVEMVTVNNNAIKNGGNYTHEMVPIFSC